MYDKVLLAVDLSDDGSWTKALPTAVELCQSYNSELHLLSIVPDMGLPVVPSFFPDNFEKEMAQETMEKLAGLATEHVPSDVTSHTHIGSGTIYKEVLRVADELSADLIVMASHRPEMSDYLLGPNAARIVRHASCSVMVVRE